MAVGYKGRQFAHAERRQGKKGVNPRGRPPPAPQKCSGVALWELGRCASVAAPRFPSLVHTRGGELSKMGEAGMHTGGWAARRGAAAAGWAAATRHLLGIEAVSWEGAPC